VTSAAAANGGGETQTAFAVSIIFVTWNGWPLLRAVLRSLIDTNQASDATEILVIDNGSTDGTAEGLAREFPAARYLPQVTNLGFARANNIGAEEASADLLFLLNNDTTVAPGAINELLNAARAHPEFDIFVPEMRIMRAPDIVDNRGIYLDGTAHFRQLDSGTPVADRRPRSEIFGASGGACLIRRRVVQQIGLFDETLESYLEDADFAARARANGFRALFVPESVILHVGSATAQRIADRKFFLIQRNMRTLWRRWIAPAPWNPTWWTGMAYEAFQAAKATRAGRLKLYVRAKRSAFRDSGVKSARAAVREWIGVKARRPDGSS
jgi:GT2 family glycosyltransferase